MRLRNLLALLALYFIVSLRCDAPAFAATVPAAVDQKLCTGSAASSGGTMTCDYQTTTDRATRVVAFVGMSNFAASHLANAGFITCEYVVENKNGTVTAVTVYTSSNNPSNSNTTTFVAAHAQAADSAFAGGGPSTCVFSVSGLNARVTVTNQGATTADVTVLLQAYTWGSQ